MTLWIAMAVLAAAASLPALVALARARAGPRSANQAALAIYRDQLDEVDRDLERGLVGDGEADAARTEIARRLIRAGEQEPAESEPTSRRGTQIAAIVIIAAPLTALGLYLAVGSPGIPDQPLASRLSAPLLNQDVNTLVARVEAHLAANPEDGAGWEILAPVYLRLGRYDDAVSAFSHALRILGSTADRESDFGEALVETHQGAVTNQARAAFERAQALAPSDPRPRFYLALALGQEGRHAEAIAAWHALLDGAPDGAPWVALARAHLAALSSPNGLPPPGLKPADIEAALPEVSPTPDLKPADIEAASPEVSPTPGPKAADIEAAAGMTPDERRTMIEGMVAALAARLETEADDAEGWARLIRSYMVLGRPADAKDAVAKARLAFAEGTQERALVDETARATGVEP